MPWSGSELLVTREAAELLSASAVTLQRWAREGRVRSIELPSGQRRFPRVYVELLVTAGESAATEWWDAQVARSSELADEYSPVGACE